MIIILLLFITLFFSFNLSVDAALCDKEYIDNLKELAEQVDVNYEYIDYSEEILSGKDGSYSTNRYIINVNLLNDELYVNYNDFQFFKLINDIIDDINNKEIIYYDDFEIKIYASKENIKKLKQNKSNYLENIENNYYDEIDDLRKENAELHDKINSLENVITDLNDKIYDLETR